jgi:hypothetical protein
MLQELEEVFGTAVISVEVGIVNGGIDPIWTGGALEILRVVGSDVLCNACKCDVGGLIAVSKGVFVLVDCVSRS